MDLIVSVPEFTKNKGHSHETQFSGATERKMNSKQ